ARERPVDATAFCDRVDSTHRMLPDSATRPAAGSAPCTSNPQFLQTKPAAAQPQSPSHFLLGVYGHTGSQAAEQFLHLAFRGRSPKRNAEYRSALLVIRGLVHP